jgi:hypothetical protein
MRRCAATATLRVFTDAAVAAGVRSTYFRSTPPWCSAVAPPIEDTAAKPLNPASAFALFAPIGYDSLFTNALLIIPIARLNISLSAGEGVIEPGVSWVSSP